MSNHLSSSKAISPHASATASWSAVAQMRGRSLASATPLSSVTQRPQTLLALTKRGRASLPTALQDAGALFAAPMHLATITACMLCLCSCDKKPDEAPKATKPTSEAPNSSWKDWMTKGTDPSWWQHQWSKASEAAQTAKKSLESLKAEELKKQASELLQAIETQDSSKVQGLVTELEKHLSVKKLDDGLNFIILQRQKGGEAAVKAIDEYAARTDLNQFEKAAAQNLKKGMETLQRDDVRGGIVFAIVFACECEFGSHEGAAIGGLIASILFPDYQPPNIGPKTGAPISP